jgi:hypothetical protein
MRIRLEGDDDMTPPIAGGGTKAYTVTHDKADGYPSYIGPDGFPLAESEVVAMLNAAAGRSAGEEELGAAVDEVLRHWEGRHAGAMWYEKLLAARRGRGT